MHLSIILKDSNYGLSQFEPTEIEALEQAIFLKETRGNQLPYVLCLIRQKHIQLKPEEIVRQLFLLRLMKQYDYPIERIGVEVPIAFGSQTKRADIVIFDKDRPTVPYIIVELKKPKHFDGKEQLRSYCNATGAPIGIWTNGTDPIEIYHRKDPNYFDKLAHLPNAYQTLKDLLKKKFTLADLIKEDALNQGKKTLKNVIEEMEDEVLANAGVDVFEESFKLIFTKLYDEFMSANNPKPQRPLQFRVDADTEAEVYAKIQKLFEEAQEKWEGVFPPDAAIELSVSHLPTCISYLQKYKLFNSNLDIIDEAFEYLINKTSKGEKGQYFTPRYVIDLCVKMLNPKPNETVIDTAAGSSGFTVHSIFHVWRQLLQQEGKDETHLFTAENKPSHYVDYVRKKVFAIDFDEKAVRVARCLNLIAGDGQTNVLHLNTLDWERWKETTGEWKWLDRYNDGFKRLRKLTLDKKGENFRDFSFDVLMANPPFAGDIKDSRLIHKYELGKKPESRASTPSKNKSAKNKGWQDKISRHILFLERNLHFLKPGGRMAIVLPQGVFNNSSDYYIRDFIAKQCRILAVVGLHPNTFKPHTGTKTSVLFVQKWNDNPKAGALCPHCEDYPIFFATQQHKGKNNSGDKIFARDAETGKLLLDKHGHKFVEHDLFSTDLENGSQTADGIAEAFIEFASKEGLSFFLHSPFNEVKYQALLGGLEIAELKLSEVLLEDKNFRIDSEFFKKEYLDIIKRFEDIESEKMFEITKEIIHPTEITRIYESQGIQIMLAQNVRNNFFDFSNEVFMNPIKGKELHKNLIELDDLVITRSGANFGQTACYKYKKEIYACADVLLIKKGNIPSGYLSTLLNTKFGKALIKRGAYGMAQPHIAPFYLRNILIPRLKTIENKIDQLIQQSVNLVEQSKTLYTQAESLLLQELGLNNWQPPKEAVAIKNFSASFGATGRLDAEYYQPKYEQALIALHQSGYPIKQLCLLIEPIRNGFDFREFTEKGTPYIRVGDIKRGQIDIDNAVKIPIVQENLKKSSIKLKIGDILFTRKGSFGSTAVVTNKEVHTIISSEIMLLRLVSEVILPDYLALFLNSPFGYLQIEQRVHGIAYYSISQEDLAEIKIVIPPISKQKRIVKKIHSSFILKDESKRLLELAKHVVELAIEQGEEAAMAKLSESEFVRQKN